MFLGLDTLAGSSCTLPVSWQGDWYESDVGRVTITTSDVSSKGTCVDTDHNFYLLENRLILTPFSHFRQCRLISFTTLDITHVEYDKMQ